MDRIMVTGSEGLVGAVLCRELTGNGAAIERVDLRLTGRSVAGDIRDPEALRTRMAGCSGVVHLAAVSRVAWGERDPDACWQTHVTGTRNVLQAAAESSSTRWVLFASSREVYGEPDDLPVQEDVALRPINLYGRSKVAAEDSVRAARERGLRTAIVRLSNVYGRIDDHPDRVAPAFARAAVTGAPLRVDGASHCFDFVNVDDVAKGLVALIGVLSEDGSALPPLHLVSGRATTLGELAELANAAGGMRSRPIDGAVRDYGVTRFVGDPTRAFALLGWRAEIGIADGMARLVRDFDSLEQARHSGGRRSSRLATEQAQAEISVAAGPD